MTPTVQTLAAVSVPAVISPCLIIAPALMKPTPVITPCRIFALLGTLAPITDMAVCTKPQAAIATRGNVRMPALCSARARCHPIGNARSPPAALRYWNMVRQRYCRRLARYRNTPCVSADPVSKPAAHTRAESRGCRPFETGCGRETDSPLDGTGFELLVPGRETIKPSWETGRPS